MKTVNEKKQKAFAEHLANNIYGATVVKGK